MSENCDVIVIFWTFGQFGAVQKPEAGFRTQSLQKFKLKTELQNLQHSFHSIALSKGTFLDKKR